MKQRIWLSFDLGLRGNYEELYGWLDNHKAKECGDGLAYLEYEHDDDLATELKAELEAILNDDPRARVYLIHKVAPNNPDNQRVRGQFLIGGRKSPPWAGFGNGDKHEIDL